MPGTSWTFPGGSASKKLTCQCKRHKRRGCDPRVGKIHEEGDGHLFQYSCLENLIDREAWRATSMGLQRVGHDWSLMHLCLLRYQGAGIHGWKGWVSAPVCGEKGEDKCTRDLPVMVKIECGNKLLLEMMVVQVNISQVHSEGRSMVKNNQERKTLARGSSSNWASESAGRDPVVSSLEVPPPLHQDRSQTLRPTAGIPNLWDLMSSDLRWNWCNNNRNKAYNKCNALESSLNQSPAPHQPSMEKLFHETSPWCQKVWGLLS